MKSSKIYSHTKKAKKSLEDWGDESAADIEKRKKERRNAKIEKRKLVFNN